MDVNEGTRIAKEMTKTHRYLYGGKGELYTTELVEKLAKSYPKKFTAALKKEALKDADQGYKAGDCSYLICKCMGLPTMNSTALKNKAVMKLKIQKKLAQEGMCLWKEGHVAYVGDGLKIYEMRNTSKDGCVSSWDKRAKDFEYMFVVKDSPLYYENQKSSQSNVCYPVYAGKSNSIVESLIAVGEKDTSFAHRKEIAIKNKIYDYKGTVPQNLQLVNLLKNGQLLKA